MSSKNLSKNQKRPEFLWFFALLQVRVPSKNQKNLEFFCFFKVMTNKKPKKTRGKPNMSLRPNILWKVLVFWFSRGFVKIILLKEKSFIKGRVFPTLHNFLKIKNRRQKKHTFKHRKKQQNTANSSKLWESMGLGAGGIIYIYIYKYYSMHWWAVSVFSKLMKLLHPSSA